MGRDRMRCEGRGGDPKMNWEGRGHGMGQACSESK